MTSKYKCFVRATSILVYDSVEVRFEFTVMVFILLFFLSVIQFCAVNW